jgi:hypothetical protein
MQLRSFPTSVTNSDATAPQQGSPIEYTRSLKHIMQAAGWMVIVRRGLQDKAHHNSAALPGTHRACEPRFERLCIAVYKDSFRRLWRTQSMPRLAADGRVTTFEATRSSSVFDTKQPFNPMPQLCKVSLANRGT